MTRRRWLLGLAGMALLLGLLALALLATGTGTRVVLERIEAKTSFAIMRHDRFSNMSEIEDFETFFRKGRIGSWKAQFSPEQAERFDRMIERRLGGSGLEFRCE